MFIFLIMKNCQIASKNFNFYELKLNDLNDKSIDAEILNSRDKVIKQIRA